MKNLYLKVIVLVLATLPACSKENPETFVSPQSGTDLKRSAGAPVSGRKILVPSPGENQNIQPAIQAAINFAANGDEIDLPEGSFIFNNDITITKFISIKGIGSTRTILYRENNTPDAVLESWGPIFTFDINKTYSSNIVISNICFKSKTPSLKDGDGGSLAADFGLKFINAVDFTVTNCRFENFGNAAISVIHEDLLSRGLIYKNEFFHNAKGPTGLGLGYGVVVYGGNTQWTSSPEFGTSNFIFIEDNSFDYHRHAVAAGGCARYVFRYNTVSNNLIAQAVDAHEARQTDGSNYYSTRAVEIYNNTIVNSTFKDGTPIITGQSAKLLTETAILIRGGEALVFNNTINGYRFGVGVINFVVQGAQNYPIFTQIGYKSGQAYGANHTGTDSNTGDGDLFAWNNNFTKYLDVSGSDTFYNYQPEYFKDGRDYHLLSKPNYTPYIYPHPKRF